MTKDPGRKPPQTASSEPQNLADDIRRRAYDLYEARGREDGQDLDDWLQAEEEITGKKARAVAA